MFNLANHGSIFILTPLTPAAHDWAADRLRWGDCSYAIEHRYARDIVKGILEDGLEVQ